MMKNILPDWDVYVEYLTYMLQLKHGFFTADYLDGVEGWGEPYKKIHHLGFYKLYPTMKYMSYDAFVNELTRITDCGSDWKEQNRATRFHIIPQLTKDLITP